MSILKVNPDSIRAICGDSQQVFVYGFSHCQYGLMQELLPKSGSPIQRTFSGDPESLYSYDITTTIEGRAFEIIYPCKHAVHPETFFKNGVASLVIENVIRQREGILNIPMLFCTDITNNKYEAPNPRSVTTTENRTNNLITHGEIRRAYKLCYDPGVDPEVQAVARQSFHFIKLNIVDDQYILEKQKAPWEQEGWDEAWATRQEDSVSIQKESKEYWRYHVNNLVRKIRGEDPIASDEFLVQQSESIRNVFSKLSAINAIKAFSKAPIAIRENPEFARKVLDKCLSQDAWKVLKCAGDLLKNNLEFAIAVLDKCLPQEAPNVLLYVGSFVKDKLEFTKLVLDIAAPETAWHVISNTNPLFRDDLEFAKAVLQKSAPEKAWLVLACVGKLVQNDLGFIRAFFGKISLHEHGQYKDYNTVFAQVYAELQEIV
ncbi:MAG: hypothetical protein WCG10_02690 [Chlamydiota bacterium]